jgi:hypothetical protein
VTIIRPDEHDGDRDNPALDLLLDPTEIATPSTAAIQWLLANGVSIESMARNTDIEATAEADVGPGAES